MEGSILMQLNNLMISARKALGSVKEDGVGFVLKKTDYVLKTRYLDPLKPDPTYPGLKQAFGTETILAFSDLPVCKETGASIGVHLHLYYVDLLKEFCSFFSNIPFPYTLYVSCPSDADTDSIRQTLRKLPNLLSVHVEQVENRGRDLAPFFINFRPHLLTHDYILHVHSKKSLHSGRERVSWRTNALKALCGSPDQVRKIFGLFEEDPSTGLFFGENYREVSAEGYSWLSCKDAARSLYSLLDLPFDETGDNFFLYPAGSFFWARTEAILPLLSCSFSLIDFPEEAGQKDGTLAHALERSFSRIANMRGYRNVILDPVHSCARIGFSRLPFTAFFTDTPEGLQKQASFQKTVCFSIFDTLLTGAYGKRTDLFRLIEAKLDSFLCKDTNFTDLRLAAERNASLRLGYPAPLTEIYRDEAFLTVFSLSELSQIEELELYLCNKLTIPRYEMRILYRSLLSSGKNILLVDDSGYSSRFLTELLHRCGYKNWSGLFLSCEQKKSREETAFWETIQSGYNPRTLLHIGSDPQKDLQVPASLNIMAHLLPAPSDSFSVSAFRESRKEETINIKERLLWASAIQKGMFNSPFSLNPETAKPLSRASGDYINAIYVPVLFAFFDDLSKKIPPTLESSLLNRLYQTYLTSANHPYKDRKSLPGTRICLFSSDKDSSSSRTIYCLQSLASGTEDAPNVHAFLSADNRISKILQPLRAILGEDYSISLPGNEKEISLQHLTRSLSILGAAIKGIRSDIPISEDLLLKVLFLFSDPECQKEDR